MWTSSSSGVLLKRFLSSALRYNKSKLPKKLGIRVYWEHCCGPSSLPPLLVPSFAVRYLCKLPDDAAERGATDAGSVSCADVVGNGEAITSAEAKKLMRLVNVAELKVKLGLEGKEVIGYSELLVACERMGVARSIDEATAFARVLDEAGVVLLFRDKVYLNPDKVVELVQRAVPFCLTDDDNLIKEELKKLTLQKEEIDRIAHKQVRRILWSGLGVALIQVGLLFRLTFWEFSWDVMEPITFFVTATGIVIGYAYFLFTRRDPSYQDLMKRLLNSRQRKLFKARNFDVERFMELQRKCKGSLGVVDGVKEGYVGLGSENEDALHRS